MKKQKELAPYNEDGSLRKSQLPERIKEALTKHLEEKVEKMKSNDPFMKLFEEKIERIKLIGIREVLPEIDYHPKKSLRERIQEAYSSFNIKPSNSTHHHLKKINYKPSMRSALHSDWKKVSDDLWGAWGKVDSESRGDQ